MKITYDDLISRQAAIDAFYRATADGDVVDFCEYVLKKVPSSEPRKGNWKIVPQWCKSSYLFKCSLCSMEQYRPSNFCPNCGAKMA